MSEQALSQRALPERLLVVLGMHRSGTSCLTGSLQEAGLFLGDCHTWNPYNLKGNRENQAFVDLHDALLQDNGGSWDNPPGSCRWSAARLEQAAQLLADNAGVQVLGFKDPRALLLIDGWRSVFPGIERVGIFRHPDAVAQSLKNRSNLTREHALNLWYVYNRALWREYRRQPFPVLCFDEQAPDFQDKVVALAQGLSLPEPLAAEFYEPGLRQYSAVESSKLPWRLRRLYRNLRRVSE